MEAPTATALTPRQRALLAAIAEFNHEFGYAPSLRELGEAVGLRSASSVHAQLSGLAELGLVERGGPGHPRSLRLTAAVSALVNRRDSRMATSSSRIRSRNSW